jgi:RNA polymerase sigma factor (sigma-70 family)
LADSTASFDQAVAVLWQAAAAVSASERSADRALVEEVVGGLRSYLITVFGRTEASEVDDVVADAIEAFWRAVSQGRVPREAASPYLLRTARNAWISEWRRRSSRRAVSRSQERSVSQEAADEIALRTLGAGMDARRVRLGMEALVARQRHVTVKIIALWLDEASLTGGSPSLRQVADRMGISHTSVRRALAEFAEHVP